MSEIEKIKLYQNAGISYYDFLKYVNDNKVLCKYFESEEQDEKK